MARMFAVTAIETQFCRWTRLCVVYLNFGHGSERLWIEVDTAAASGSTKDGLYVSFQHSQFLLHHAPWQSYLQQRQHLTTTCGCWCHLALRSTLILKPQATSCMLCLFRNAVKSLMASIVSNRNIDSNMCKDGYADLKIRKDDNNKCNNLKAKLHRIRRLKFWSQTDLSADKSNRYLGLQIDVCEQHLIL